jgi:hypothetical protein
MVLTKGQTVCMLGEISDLGKAVSLVRNKVFDLVRGEILSCALLPGEELREGDPQVLVLRLSVYRYCRRGKHEWQ